MAEEKAEKKSSTKQNLSVKKLFATIEVMANHKYPMRLQDISQKVGLPPSTVLRFLSTMCECNYAKQNSQTLKYSLTQKFCLIGALVGSSNSVFEVGHSHLIELSQQCNEAVCLGIEQDMNLLYLDAVESPTGILRAMHRIGRSAPLHCTGIGKIILADYSEAQLERYIREKGLQKFTETTITSQTALMGELAKIRESGISLDNEECEAGAKCVAAAVRNYSGAIVAGISITAPSARVDDEKLAAYSELVLQTARNISRELGYEAL